MKAHGYYTIVEIFDGNDGEQGYSIVASVSRPNFTEDKWNTYGEVGHVENWTATESIRNGCRIGDIFTVVGTATDTGNAHVLYYRSDTASGTLHGVCISHSVAKKGADGTDGIGITGTTLEYQKSSSGTTIPTSWLSSIPTLNQGEYLWTRVTTHYSGDVDDSYSYSVSRIGKDGTDGETPILYALSWTNTDVPSGSWTITLYKDGVVCTDRTYASLVYAKTIDTEPSFADPKSGSGFTGTFTWTSTEAYKYLVKVYSDSAMTNLLCITSLSPGAQGNTGVGVESTTRYYKLQESSISTYPSINETVKPPTGWSNTEPAYQSGYKMYFVDLTIYTDGTFKYSPVSLSSSYTAANDAMDKVDNLNVGGRNLALGTKESREETDGIISYDISTYGYINLPDKEVVLSYTASTNEDTVLKLQTDITDSSGIVSTPIVTLNIDGSNKRYIQKLKINPTLTLTSETDKILLNFRFDTSVDSSNTGKTLHLENVKLEIGNKPTDWTEAPEDIESNSLSGALGAIEEAIKDFSDELVDKYLDKSEYGTFVESYSATIKELADRVKINIEKITAINGVTDKVNTYFDFNLLGLVIGKSTSKVVSVSTPEGLIFIPPDLIDENDESSLDRNAVAKYTVEGLETKNVYSKNQVGITDDWVIRPGATRANKGKNLNIMWIGG